MELAIACGTACGTEGGAGRAQSSAAGGSEKRERRLLVTSCLTRSSFGVNQMSVAVLLAGRRFCTGRALCDGPMFLRSVIRLFPSRKGDVRFISCPSASRGSCPLVLQFNCDLQGRKINLTNSKNLVGWLVDVATVPRVTFDLPECKEPSKKKKKRKENASKKKKTRTNKMKRNAIKKKRGN